MSSSYFSRVEVVWGGDGWGLEALENLVDTHFASKLCQKVEKYPEEEVGPKSFENSEYIFSAQKVLCRQRITIVGRQI